MEITTIKNQYVTAEVVCTDGIGIHLVGIPDNMVKSSLLRVVTAMQKCGYHIPGKKVIINLTTSSKLKWDDDTEWWLHLPIALGIIHASGQAHFSTENEAPAFRMNLGGGLLAYVPGVLCRFIPLSVYDTDEDVDRDYTLRDLVGALNEYATVMELDKQTREDNK